jgi:hypothetical protein
VFFFAALMKSKKQNKETVQKNGGPAETPEESLKRIIENAKLKNEAYKKILKSLNINKNK